MSYLVPDEEEIPSFDDKADLVTMTPFRSPTILPSIAGVITESCG
jgi:hypothetical protein